MKWRAQELIFLDSVAESDEGRAQIKKSNVDRREGRSYWFRNATNLFIKKYKEEFPDCFQDETTVEFAYRRQRQPHAKLQRYTAETETERDTRLSTVNKASSEIINRGCFYLLPGQRIESWLKSRSESRTRSKQSNAPPSDTPPSNVSLAAPPTISAPIGTDAATLAASVVQFATTRTLKGFGLSEGANRQLEVASMPAPQVVSNPRSVMPTDE